MKLQRNLPWKTRLTSLLTGGCFLISVASAVADIGTVEWQQKYEDLVSESSARVG
jgi:hypothetical protein